MKRKKYSILNPKDNTEYKKISAVTMHDLGLDLICKELSKKESERNYIMNIMSMIYADPYVTSYRCDVFDDIITNKKMRDELMDILNKIDVLRDYRSFRHDYDENSGIWDLMHRLGEINDYIKCVNSLYECLKDQNIHSAGFTGLREYVEGIYKDNGFGELKDDISGLTLDTSKIKSITVGINLDDQFEADGIGLLSVNSRYFTKAGVLSNFYDHLANKDKINDDATWNGDYKFHPFDGALPVAQETLISSIPRTLSGITGVPDGDQTKDITRYSDRVVNHMISQMVKRAREVLNKYVSITITDMTDLIPELMYYIRWAEYIEKLRANGSVFSKPTLHIDEKSEGGHYMKARGVYNIKLAAFDTEESGSIVTNELDFDEDHRVYILTGANRGGKTTITQCIGQLFVLAQGGIYIPGDEFVFSPVDCIYTHFPADEDKTLDLGRLGEECKRFKEIFDDATGKSLMLLNETFSTTSFEEGYYIAKDSVRAILDKGIRTIFNTHMHKLAFDIGEMNDENADGKAYSLIIHSDGSRRSYKIELAPPAGKSYASDIAEKYGVTYDMLVNRTHG